METKQLEALEINIGDDEYILDFDIESVKAFGKYSLSHNGKMGDEVFLKYALQKHHKHDVMLSNKSKQLQETLASLDEDDDMSYTNVIEYLMALFMQAIDNEAKKVEPSTVTIEKDNSVTVNYDGDKYKLTFNRADIKDALINGDSAFGSSNALELYTVGTSLLKLATKHYNRRFSVRFHDNLFLSLWATKFNKETEDIFPEVLNALVFHIQEVANSGIKNSKPVIKIATKSQVEQ